MSNKKGLYFVLGVLCFSVIALSVAFAALSNTLTINFGNVVQQVETWNICFNTSISDPTPGGTSDTGRSCGAASATCSTVTIANTSLSKPGDSCTWNLQVKNTGSIAATFNAITATAPSGVTCANSNNNATMTCGNIKYSLTSNGTTALATGGTVAASTGTMAVVLKAEYVGTGVNGSAITQSGAKFTLGFTQA